MREIECAICGKKILTDRRNLKYCPDCKAKASSQVREVWKKKTNYREKQMLAARKRRAEEREKQRECEAIKRKEDTKKREIENKLAKELREKEFYKKLGKGDCFANMNYALMKKDDKRYWKYFKKYEIEFAESCGKKSKTKVNGISILEPNFENLVIESVAKLGVIRVNC